jgi:hypothetical protein
MLKTRLLSNLTYIIQQVHEGYCSDNVTCAVIIYVQVIAEEKNTNPRLSSTATVIVSIADANDNVPVFQQQQYTASVSEMASPGTLVTTITATDRDSGQFGENGIVYQLPVTDADKLVLFLIVIT